MQAHMAASTVALASHGPFPFVNSPMTAREDGGHVKLPLAFVAPASEIPLEEGVDYSTIIAALLRVSSLLDVFFPWCLD